MPAEERDRRLEPEALVSSKNPESGRTHLYEVDHYEPEATTPSGFHRGRLWVRDVSDPVDAFRHPVYLNADRIAECVLERVSPYTELLDEDRKEAAKS